MKQTTGAQGAWAGKEETTAHLTQKELDCPGARIALPGTIDEKQGALKHTQETRKNKKIVWERG